MSLGITMSLVAKDFRYHACARVTETCVLWSYFRKHVIQCIVGYVGET